jgi:beta-glucosidase
MSFTISRGRAASRPMVARLGLVALAFAMAACGTASPTGTPPATPAPNATSARPWMDTTKTVDQRVQALLSAMTLDEKIGQMTQVQNYENTIGYFALRDPEEVQTDLFGSVLSGGSGNPMTESGLPMTDTALNWYEMVDAYAQAALRTRLGIPLLYGADMVHGASHVWGTTIFPHNVGLGATRDAALVTKVCQVTAAEMYASGVRWNFGPVVAVPQDVRWGRTYEGYGENTELVAQLGTACVTGLQDKKLTDPNTVVADPKHFIGDGGTAFGSSTTVGMTQDGSNVNVPYLLDQGVDKLDNATITKLFLPPYESAVKNGARIVMTSFSSTQAGGKISGDKYWITDILKTQLGFTGFVLSDWGAIDQINPDDYMASVKAAINAGEDMIMVPDKWVAFQGDLKLLVKKGDVAQSRIDDAVSRILRVKFEMGLFENPMPPAGADGTVGSDANRAIASQAVSESAVLLKNAGGALPVAAGSSVLLAGAGADNIGTSSGGQTIEWQGGSGNITKGTTLRAALEAKLGDNVTYDANGDFAGGTHAKTGVVVVAEPPYAEGLGDSATLTISPAELAVIDKVKPLVDKLVVVIISGRPVMLKGISDKADAVVAAWLPGTEDEGLADVLLGTKPFTGTTPYTWPKTPDDAPRIGKTACQGAVYPYGYGLDTTGKLLGAAAC